MQEKPDMQDFFVPEEKQVADPYELPVIPEESPGDLAENQSVDIPQVNAESTPTTKG